MAAKKGKKEETLCGFKRGKKNKESLKGISFFFFYRAARPIMSVSTNTLSSSTHTRGFIGRFFKWKDVLREDLLRKRKKKEMTFSTQC